MSRSMSQLWLAFQQRVKPLADRLRAVSQSPLGRAAIVTAVLTVFCKLIGFFREQVVASTFGIDGGLDAFHVAILLPTMVTNIVLQNLSVALVMESVRLRTRGDETAGRRLLTQGIFWGCLFSATISILAALLGPQIMAMLYPAMAPHLAAQASRMLWMLIPYATISGVTVIWATLLNTEGRFMVTALSPGVISLAIMGCLWFSGHSDPEAMILGFTIGAFVDLLNLGRSLQAKGLPLTPQYGGWSPTYTTILATSFPLVAGSMLHCGTEIVDQSMASWLGEGSISELKYGNRIVGMVFGVVTIPISQVIFPHLIRLSETGKWSELQSTAQRAALGTLLVSLPFTLVLVIFSREIVGLSFEHGKFTSESTMQVAAVQAMYALQLPFYLWGIVLVRVAMALRMNSLILVGGVLNLSVNVAMNYVLMKPLGVTGIALSTAIVYLGSACYFSAAIRVALQRKIREEQAIDLHAPIEKTPSEPLRRAA